MKYLNLFMFLMLIFPSDLCFAQSHQVYGSLGYNLPTTTAVIGRFFSNQEIKLNLSTFSKGLIFQGGYSFGINKNLLLDLNINYLIGVKDEIYFSYLFNEQLFVKYSNSNIAISPTLNMKYDIGNFSPYIKFGGSINFIKIKEVWDSPTNPTFREEYVYSNDYTLGWIAGVGLDYLFAINVLLFTELQLNSITFYPNETEYSRIDGNLKTTYIYHPKENLPGGSGYASSEAVQDFPFSSIGILVGLRLLL